jgi:hypothetical protein
MFWTASIQEIIEGKVTDVYSGDVETLSWLFDGVGMLFNMTNLLSFKEGFDESAVLKLTDHILESIRVDPGPK